MWWSIPGRTVAFVLDHIAAGNNPRLTMLQVPRALGASQDEDPGVFVLALSLIHAEDTTHRRHRYRLAIPCGGGR
jgi:hypothetical protein